ncbi:septum site-determining protein MinC [Sphaerotilus sp.]|jgi:septum site-determining protein MinC|uniref:septum site-determining protein MinC n=1 Tax=Sphaerotilus sp. TaxID=2093942 RepID=UPI0025FF902B|nr:septum site-determining protein MinC [Sphaerotilus sp.]
MAIASPGNSPAVFDLKSATLTLVALVVKSPHLPELAEQLRVRLGPSTEFFNQDPVLIDLAQVQESAGEIDFRGLIELLRSYSMVPVAVRGGSAAQMAAAQAAGLCEVPPQDGPAVRAAAPAPAPVRAASVVVVDRPLRSGQQVYAKGADLVILALVNHGAEVIADGSIHVYAPLRGKAIAGATGDVNARIFTTCMEPELISIAGIYQTTDPPLPTDVRGKSAQVRLDGDTLIIEPIKA